MSEDFDYQREKKSLLEESERLKALVEDWEDDDYSEDEEALLIDLEKVSASQHTGDGDSTYSSFVESGSVKSARASLEGGESKGDSVSELHLSSASHRSSSVSGPEQALALNRALQEMLKGYIEKICEAIEENKQAQVDIEEEKKADHTHKQKATASGPFRSPYFKTDTSYPPPNNDTLKKRATDEPKGGLTKDHVTWKRPSRDILREAVFHNLRAQALQPIMNKHDREVKKKKELEDKIKDLEEELVEERQKFESMKSVASDNDEELRNDLAANIEKIRTDVIQKKIELDLLNEKIGELASDMKQISLVNEEAMLSDVDTEKVDWMLISKSRFGQNTTWLDCKKAWDYEVKNRHKDTPWTEEELEQLGKLVDKFGLHQWEEVAKNMENRSTFQCFSIYQMRLSNQHKQSREWTNNEDERLIKTVKKVLDRFGVLAWKRVATMMDSRNPNDCMLRYSKIDPGQKHGRWTEEEDARLIAAVETMGVKWHKIAKFMGTRNMFQCRDRYMNCLDTRLNYSYFSYNEDQLLLRLQKKYGNVWAQMALSFSGRTDAMLMNRFRTLQKWRDQQKWFEDQCQDMKDLLRGRFLPRNERKEEEEKVYKVMTRDLGIWKEDYRRQKEDAQKGMEYYEIPPRPPFHLKLAKGIKHCTGSIQNNAWLKRLEETQLLLINLKASIRRRNKEDATIDSEDVKDMIADSTTIGSLANVKEKDHDTEENYYKLIDGTDISTNIMNKVNKEKGNKVRKKRESVPHNVIEIQQSLNRMFLGDHTVTVQELINHTFKSSRGRGRTPRSKSMWEPVSDNVKVMNDLRRLLRRRLQIRLRKGKVRLLVPKDSRPDEEVRGELDKLETTVPAMLVKSLGSDLQNIHKNIRMKKLDAEENYARSKFSDTDPKYLEQVQKLTNEAEEIRIARENLEISDDQYIKMTESIERRRKGAQNVIRRLYSSQRLEAESSIKVLNCDKAYTDQLLGLVKVQKKRHYKGLHDNEEDEESEKKQEGQDNDKGQTQKDSEEDQPVKDFEKSEDKTNGQMIKVNGKTKENDDEKEEIEEDNKDKDPDWDEVNSHISSIIGVDENLRKEFFIESKPSETEPKSKGRRPSQRFANSMAKLKLDAVKKWFGKKPKAPAPPPISTKTLEEILEERDEIKLKDKKFVTSLPYFPPCTTTMNALKTLLMVKSSIQLKASQLLLASQDRKKKTKAEATLHVIHETEPETGLTEIERSAQHGTEEVMNPKNSTEDKLLVPSERDELLQQASQFDGFKTKSLSTGRRVHSLLPSTRKLKKLGDQDKGHGDNEIPDIASFSQLPKGLENSLKIDPVYLDIPPDHTKTLYKNVQSEYEIVMDVTKKAHPPLPSFKTVEPTMNHNEQRFTYLKADRDIKKEKGFTESDPLDCKLGTDENEGKNQSQLAPNEDCELEIDEQRSSKVHSICIGQLGPDGDAYNTSQKSSRSSLSNNLKSHSQVPAKKIINTSESDMQIASVSGRNQDQIRKNTSYVVGNDVSSSNPKKVTFKKEPERSQSVVREEEPHDILSSKQYPPYSSSGSEIKIPQAINVPNIPIIKKLGYRRLKNVVIAGLDPTGKRVVHFKHQGNNHNIGNFKAFEERPIEKIEVGKGPRGPPVEKKPPTERDIWQKKIITGDYLDEVRQCPEYKLLFARFKAVFMWPGLLSTVVPRVRPSAPAPPEVGKYGRIKKNQSGGENRKMTPRKKKQCKDAILKRWANHPNRIKEKEAKEKEEKEREAIEIEAKKKQESGGGGDEAEGGRDEAEPKPPKRKRLHTQRQGCAGQPQRRSSRKRPWEEAQAAQKEAEAQEAKAKESAKDAESAKVPQWWKDAMLAAMISKKAMADGSEKNMETFIEDDPDFQDQGTYSDDEWNTEMEVPEEAEGLSGMEGVSCIPTNQEKH